MAFALTKSRQNRATSVSSDSSIMGDTTDDSIRVKHGSSTPPTSLSSGPSDIADAPKDEPQVERRSARARYSIGSYNLQVLAGTNIHTPTKYLRMQAEAAEAEPKKPEAPRTLQDFTSTDDKVLASSLGDYWKLDTSPKPRPVVKASAEASDKNLRRKSSRLDLVKEATSNAVAAATSATSRLLGGKDTDQSSGKPQTRSKPSEKADADPRTPTKRGRATTTESPTTATPEPPPKPVAHAKDKRKWVVNEGLYKGQAADPEKDYADQKVRAKKVQRTGAAAKSVRKGSDWFPLPMFHGAKIINTGRDFKLPREILNPLPRGEKVDGWKLLSRNRPVDDDSREAYNRLCTRKKQEAISMCECQEECDPDNCLNAMMNYECDEKNCKPGKDNCNNRPFASLEARTSTQGRRGNMYDVGVEVVKTQDRGYGVRAMRAFRPGQIIMEYTGEMIDQTECDRRMNEEYKENQCYYLMTFDGGLIIDATKGSMARFVNHSCDSNCEMIMWLVRDRPRMALFAKDGHIQAGDELTYDYNFEAFNASWKQDCRCGAGNCRGVLGPRTRDARIKEMVTKVAKGVKRTAQAAFEGMASLGAAANKKQRKDNSPKKTEMKSVTSRKALMAPAVAADAISPKKASQSASREARAAARHITETPSRGRRQNASRNEATRRAEEIRRKQVRQTAVARKRLAESRAMKAAMDQPRQALPKASAKAQDMKNPKITKPVKQASASASLASKAYAKKRAKLAASSKAAPGPRSSPRQRKISAFFKTAMKSLMTTDSDDEDAYMTDDSDVSVDEEARTQIEKENAAASTVRQVSKTHKKGQANPGPKKRAIKHVKSRALAGPKFPKLKSKVLGRPARR